MRDPGSHSRAAMRIYYVRIGDSGRQGKQSPEKKSQKNPAHRPQSEDRQAADVPASNSGVQAVRPFEAADQRPRFRQQRTARPGWTTRRFDFAQHTLTSASKHISTPTRPRREHPLGCSDSKRHLQPKPAARFRAAGSRDDFATGACEAHQLR